MENQGEKRRKTLLSIFKPSGPSSTTTNEVKSPSNIYRIKLIKTALRNKMEEEFLADSTMIHIERELIEDDEIDSIIDEFLAMKNRRVQLK